MRYICELHNGFKLADKFADIHLYKVVTEKYTYFYTLFYGMGDYNFYIFAYNNEKMGKYNDSLLVESIVMCFKGDCFSRLTAVLHMYYYNPT